MGVRIARGGEHGDFPDHGRPAVGLDLLVRSLQTHGVGSGIILYFQIAEYAFLNSDLVLLLAFLWQTIVRKIRKL